VSSATPAASTNDTQAALPASATTQRVVLLPKTRRISPRFAFGQALVPAIGAGRGIGC